MLAKDSFGKSSANSENLICTEDRPKIASDTALEALLNIDEAARIIGRAHWTLRRDIKCGKLICVRVGRRIMIEPSEIRRLIEEGREGRS